MPNRSRLLLAFALAAPLLLPAAKPDKPVKKEKGPFVAAKPAFTPNYDAPAFDPAAVKPEHLDTSMFKVPEGLEITVWATSPQLFNPANMDIDQPSIAEVAVSPNSFEEYLATKHAAGGRCEFDE